MERARVDSGEFVAGYVDSTGGGSVGVTNATSTDATGAATPSAAASQPASELKPESWAWHLLGLIVPFSVIFGNLSGGIWVISTAVLTLIVYPLLDAAFGQSKVVRPVRENGRPFEVILHTHSILHLILVSTLIWRATQDGNNWTTWAAAFSTGMGSGISGIVVAHELGHKRPKSLSWRLGRLNLFVCLYAHYTTEHNHNHHRYVATAVDPASAPLGRGFWLHLLGTVPRQFISSWRIERTLAAKKGRSASPLYNPTFHYLLLEFGMLSLIWWFAGVAPLLAFIGQAGIAILLLEYVNYIRHYGLSRAVGERQTEMHSWQTERRWSRWTLLELTRHPAHHMKASEPYWRLQPYEGVPTLPAGYFGCFWPCVIPPLWHRWLGPLIPPK
jgi:alkane 1-monooxygenase